MSIYQIEGVHFFQPISIFLPGNFLLDNAGRIRRIPAVILRGHYDAVCPIVSADDLAQKWPEADYLIIDDAGHSAFEPGIRKALIGATDKLRDRLRWIQKKKAHAGRAGLHAMRGCQIVLRRA